MKTAAHNTKWVLAAFFALVWINVSGCADTSGLGRVCTVDEECVSGICLPNGLCSNTEDLGQPDSGSESSTAEPALSAEDMGHSSDMRDAATTETGHEPEVDEEVGRYGCLPNNDGVITADEAPFGANHTAMFRVTTDVTGFYSEPECDSDGCVWDLLHVNGSTDDLLVSTEESDGWWFSDDPAFADATYVAPMGDFALSLGAMEVCSQQQFGVFQVTDNALLVLGLVSEHEEDGTKLIYDPPLPMLKFPMEDGDSWVVETTASGPLCNSWVDYNVRQTAETDVDAWGTVRTPFGDFENVLRVNTLLRRHMGVGVMPTQIRTHLFVAECFTSIATIVSEEGETDADFDRVHEVRRLTPLP